MRLQTLQTSLEDITDLLRNAEDMAYDYLEEIQNEIDDIETEAYCDGERGLTEIEQSEIDRLQKEYNEIDTRLSAVSNCINLLDRIYNI